MITNITPYNIHNNNKRTQPSFTALYFKNAKIQRKVQNSHCFAEVLNTDCVEEAIQKYNVVITDVPKWFQRGWNFKFRGCTEVVQKGENIIPAGFKSPVFCDCDHQYNLIKNLRVLDYTDNFNKLYFKTPKMKKAFMDHMFSKNVLSYLNDPVIKEAIGKNKIYVTQVNDKDIKFIMCTKITQNKKGAIVPEGYQSTVVNGKDPCGLARYKRDLDKILAVYDKLYFKNDKVRQQFLAHNEHDSFLTNNIIRESVEKYNIVVNDAKEDIKFVISSDIAQNKNKIIPANLYSGELNYSKMDNYELENQGLKHLEKLIEYLNPKNTASDITTTPNNELFF